MDFLLYLPTFGGVIERSGISSKLWFTCHEISRWVLRNVGGWGVHDYQLCLQILIYKLCLRILIFFVLIEIYMHIQKNRLSINLNQHFIHVPKHPCSSKARSHVWKKLINIHYTWYLTREGGRVGVFRDISSCLLFLFCDVCLQI